MTTNECICPRFSDTGGFRIADLTCPTHGVGGTNPGDGPWDDDESSNATPEYGGSMRPVKAPPDSQESLARHMDWLYGKDGVYGGDGTQRCLCEHAYENLGRLEGISMGKGWVRTSTHPGCPFHANR